VTKLLVAFDGSESALHALRHAIGLARAHPPLAIHLVNAYEEPIEYPEVGVIYAPLERRVALLRAQSAEILAAGEKLLRDAGVPHSTEILNGPVGPTIAERADTLACDGIVMGTRGMGAVRNLVLGSVATKVVHAAHVPVTLVR
jgi:nucleotide-binding universal stress UspA family protein